MSTVDEIKTRIDIVDLVSQYVALKRAGRGFVAPCPFHQERTPSFHVDPSRQTWHCFGACGTGGDIFNFVMKKENVDFREALRLLAERAGIALDGGRDRREDAHRARLFELNQAAAAFFHSTLLQSPAAQAARDYIEERGVAGESLERFQLGYAPGSWDALLSHVQSRGFTSQEAQTAGLAIEGDRGPYDRFRHRLMFAIRDERGRVAGFGGRLLPGEAPGSGVAQPKYVNISQSPIFDKGSILYGLDLAKDAIRREGQAVIVEGYMDAIAAHEHGFANVVASMGTSLTERQVTLLKRYTRRVVLALDADAAGSEATFRGVEVVATAADHEYVPVPNWRGVIRQQEQLAADICVLGLPPRRDPDDVIRSDPEQWTKLIREAKPVLDHLFDAAAQRHDLTSPRDRAAATSELLPLVASITDRVVQAHYLQRLARLAQTDEATLRLELRRPQRAAPRRADVDEANEQRAVPSRPRVRDRKEEFCLALLFRYPELLSEGRRLSGELFAQSENRALFEAWLGTSGEGEQLVRSLPTDIRTQYDRISELAIPAYDSDGLMNALHSTVQGIEQQRLRLAKRTTAAVLAGIDAKDNARIAEAAHAAWQSGQTDPSETTDEIDPAAAFIEDMQTGLKVHQRLLERQRGVRLQADEVPHEQ